MSISNEALANGLTIALTSGQQVTAAPDSGRLHLTVNSHHGSVAHVHATPAEARDVAALLLALADSVDASKGAA